MAAAGHHRRVGTQVPGLPGFIVAVGGGLAAGIGQLALFFRPPATEPT